MEVYGDNRMFCLHFIPCFLISLFFFQARLYDRSHRYTHGGEWRVLHRASAAGHWIYVYRHLHACRAVHGQCKNGRENNACPFDNSHLHRGTHTASLSQEYGKKYPTAQTIPEVVLGGDTAKRYPLTYWANYEPTYLPNYKNEMKVREHGDMTWEERMEHSPSRRILPDTDIIDAFMLRRHRHAALHEECDLGALANERSEEDVRKNKVTTQIFLLGITFR
jgi:hypothetical protein